MSSTHKPRETEIIQRAIKGHVGSSVQRILGGPRDLLRPTKSAPDVYSSPISSSRTNPPKSLDDERFKSSILVWINSYNRSDDLRNLLEDIVKNKKSFNITVMILDDFSSSSNAYINMIKEFALDIEIIYHRMTFNHGKKGYWKLCTYALKEIQKLRKNFKYFIKLDDDCRLVNDFFIKCVNIWESIDDEKKICLNFRLDSREGKAVWTKIKPNKFTFSRINVYLAQWVDLDFFCDGRMFDALRYYITEQSYARWHRSPNTSSGVGRDISLRLVSNGHHLYLTTESLVVHNHHDSRMNPEERNRNPLVTKPITNLDYGLQNL